MQQPYLNSEAKLPPPSGEAGESVYVKQNIPTQSNGTLKECFQGLMCREAKILKFLSNHVHAHKKVGKTARPLHVFIPILKSRPAYFNLSLP
jgi:hypothetical protein